VVPRPPRRRPAKKRFERPVANDLWQIDATQVKLAEDERVWVVDIVDRSTTDPRPGERNCDHPEAPRRVAGDRLRRP
jgi:hypothetical protein